MKNVEVGALNTKHGNIYYLPQLKNPARDNRHSSTIAETIIWEKVLRYKKTGYKFTRQKPINRFILDFYCARLNLAIEIDGSSHKDKKGYDTERDIFLKQIGIKTIRFTNDEVINNLDFVSQKVQKMIPTLSRGGGR